MKKSAEASSQRVGWAAGGPAHPLFHRQQLQPRTEPTCGRDCAQERPPREPLGRVAHRRSHAQLPRIQALPGLGAQDLVVLAPPAQGVQRVDCDENGHLAAEEGWGRVGEGSGESRGKGPL